MLGIIGGSGLDRIAKLEVSSQRTMSTPYGPPSAAFTWGTLGGREIVFLPRHGAEHAIAPHCINYRANLWALQEQGIRDVVAVCAVGGISKGMDSGTLLLPDQIIDYTHGRAATFFDGAGKSLAHTDFTMPFCQTLRQRLMSAGAAAGETVLDGGTYAATQGPRLETAAEIDRLERDGAHVVGMTGMPEAVLARELGLCYAMVAAVVNPAAGRGSSSGGVSMDEIHAVAEAAMQRVCKLLGKLE